MIKLAPQTPDHIPRTNILVSIVDVNIPTLIGRGVLDGNFLLIDNISSRLYHHVVILVDSPEIVDKMLVPLIRSQRHFYVHLRVPTSTFYTMQQFRRLYHQFAVSSAVKLYNLPKRVGLEAVDSNTLHQLERIVAQCDPCQRMKNAPHGFRDTFSQ